MRNITAIILIPVLCLSTASAVTHKTMEKVESSIPELRHALLQDEAVFLVDFHERYQPLSYISSDISNFVWMCRDVKVEENVAVKFIANKAEWRQEVEILQLASETRTNIPRILSHSNNTTSALSYILFDAAIYASGSLSLDKYLESLEGAVDEEDPRWSIYCVYDIASTLDRLSTLGIYHGDLTHKNIIISKDLDVSIVGFGRGGVLKAGESIIDKYDGGVKYASPEARMLIVGARVEIDAFKTDVYAVGAIFFRMLFGIEQGEAFRRFTWGIEKTHRSRFIRWSRTRGVVIRSEEMVLLNAMLDGEETRRWSMERVTAFIHSKYPR